MMLFIFGVVVGILAHKYWGKIKAKISELQS